MAHYRLMEAKQWRLEVPDSEDVGVLVDVIEVVVSGVEFVHPSPVLQESVWHCLDGLPIASALLDSPSSPAVSDGQPLLLHNYPQQTTAFQS